MKKGFFYSILLASALLLLANGLADKSMIGHYFEKEQAPSRIENTWEGEAQLAQPKSNYPPISDLKFVVENNEKVILTWKAPANSNFSVCLEERFNQTILPEGWLNIDADGDGQTWRFKDYWNSPDETGYAIGSESWGTGYKDGGKPAFTPNNWLITKKFTVPTDGKLQFDVASHSSTFNAETYGVYLSETGTEIADFSKELLKETISDPIRKAPDNKNAKAAWLSTRTVDLAAYAGKDVYLAFRHFDSYDQMAMLLDNILVYSIDPNAASITQYNIYRNNELIGNSSELTFTDNNVNIGTSSYEVEVKYSDGTLSQRVAVNVIVFDPNGVAIIELEAHNVWSDGSGYQVYLDNTATQFGQAIPIGGALTPDCNITTVLQNSFSHFIPANAQISCTPELVVIDGKAEIEVAAGYYDWCVANPSPGDKIWIAGKGRFNDYPFEGGKRYHILAEKDPASTTGSDHIVVTISNEVNELNPVSNLTGRYDELARNVKLNWNEPISRSAALHESFDEGIPNTWKVVDADGDNKSWLPSGPPASPGFEGSNSVISYSWLGTDLTPDNWLISPQFTVPSNGELSYWIGALHSSFLGDTYGVFISETTDDVSAFTELFSQSIAGKSGKSTQARSRNSSERAVGEWNNHKIDLSDYQGKEVYIAFRHYDSDGIFGIILDEIKVSDASELPAETFSYNVYCNENLIGNVEHTHFTHNNSVAGSYKYEVEVLSSTGTLSPKKAVEVQVPVEDTFQADPVNNLRGSYDFAANKINIKWDKPLLHAKVLYEKFEGGIPSTWLNVDADGDGHSWVSVSPEFSGVNPETGETDLGTDCPTSASYISGVGPVTPDNWLITPRVKIPSNGKLSFWVRGYDPNAFQEHYGVFLSETDTEISSFNKELFSESLIRADVQRYDSQLANESEEKGRGHWNFRTIDLADYAGKEVYIAFRHYEITDKYWLMLDEVTITGEADLPQDLSWTYSIYQNANTTPLVQNHEQESYTQSNPASGNQEFEIEVHYSNELISPKASVTVNVAPNNPENQAFVFLKSEDVWNDGTGYQMYLDNTATQFGNAIPTIGPLVTGCDIPAELTNKLSHRIPANADISCTPEHQIVSGEEMIAIPAGVYDYCIANPEPGRNIWIASGENGRKDNYRFEAGKEYHFQTALQSGYDMILITVIESTDEIVSTASAYGIEGFIVVDSSHSIALSVFDIQGRRITTKSISSKTMIPCEAGIYVVKLSSGSKSQAYKVIVK